MDWQTKEEVRAAAEKGVLAAIHCSKKHWWQAVTATSRELWRAHWKDQFDTRCSFCALCYRFLLKGKRGCPLKRRNRFCGDCCEEWFLADDAYKNWKDSRGSHSDFVKAARKLHKRLCLEERKFLAKRKNG